jgi:glycosyltransferase involved in cell wall biosynthesis
LYQGALALVFPSRYEGFGIPPLEAMACGCPVICTTAASLVEVCGEAVLYFDPLDIEALREQMECLASDPSQRDRLRQAGLGQAQKFTWRQTALQTWKLLESYL